MACCCRFQKVAKISMAVLQYSRRSLQDDDRQIENVCWMYMLPVLGGSGDINLGSSGIFLVFLKAHRSLKLMSCKNSWGPAVFLIWWVKRLNSGTVTRLARGCPAGWSRAGPRTQLSLLLACDPLTATNFSSQHSLSQFMWSHLTWFPNFLGCTWIPWGIWSPWGQPRHGCRPFQCVHWAH